MGVEESIVGMAKELICEDVVLRCPANLAIHAAIFRR
jgi:hypothetical protein